MDEATQVTWTRRSLICGGAAAGAASTLAACGLSGSSQAQRPVEGPKEVAWSISAPGEPREGYWRETFRAAEQATGVKITPLFETGLLAKRQAEFAAGTTNADLMGLNLNQHISLGLDGMILDLAEYLRRDKVDLKQYYKADFEAWGWKGKQFAMPWASGGVCVLYNKRLFDERGIKYPAKDWTYDDLLEMARRFTNSSADRYGLHVQQNGLNYMMGSFVHAFGGKLLNDTKDRALYGDDSNTLRAVEFNVDLHTRQKVAIGAEGIGKLAGKLPIEVGAVPMEMNGIFRHSTIRVAIGDPNLDFAPFPKGPAGQRAAVAGNAWGVLKLSQAKDAAWRVLSWTHTRDGMLKTPQLKGVAWPVTTWAAGAPEWQDMFKGTRIAEVTKVWENGGHDILPVPELTAWTVMNAPITKALTGEMTARDALRESARQLNELFAQRPAHWK